MQNNLRQRLLDLAGWTYHHDGKVIDRARYNWTDPQGEGRNTAPVFVRHEEVIEYLQQFLTKHRLTAVIVLDFRGKWDVELVDKSGDKTYQHHKGADLCDVIANAILEAAGL